MATVVFSVIGEHRNEPERLLLLGDDGHYYAFSAGLAQPTEVKPSGEWTIDTGFLDPQSVDLTDDNG
jgi:hypothetical protein